MNTKVCEPRTCSGRLLWIAVGPTDLEQIITGHARLARDSSRNNDQITALQGVGQFIIALKALMDQATRVSVAHCAGGCLQLTPTRVCKIPYLHLGPGVYVADIGSYSLGVSNIEQRQVLYLRVHL